MENERKEENKMKEFACTVEGCNASFTKNRKLINHTRRHLGERPFLCNVEGCERSYTNSSHLLRHKKTHLGVRERIPCDFEGCAAILNKESLKKHKDLMHNPEKMFPFVCTICEEGFHRKKELKIHVFKHTGICPFTCDKCGVKCTTIADLNRHKRSHNEYECKCSLKFERWTALRTHQAQCKVLCHKCDLCNKYFSRRDALRKHIDEQHNTGPVEVFVCNYDENCKRKYYHKRNLQHHIRYYHEKEEKSKIPCPQCDKFLSSQQKLKVHIKGIHEKKAKPTKRKPRKDKNTPKKNIISVLTGQVVPQEINETVTKGGLLDEDMEEVVNNRQENVIKTKTKSKNSEASSVEVIGVPNCGNNNEDITKMKFVVIEYKHNNKKRSDDTDNNIPQVTTVV